jgi:hypothetical protein
MQTFYAPLQITYTAREDKQGSPIYSFIEISPTVLEVRDDAA